MKLNFVFYLIIRTSSKNLLLRIFLRIVKAHLQEYYNWVITEWRDSNTLYFCVIGQIKDR